jgi:hypothetical protein
MSERLAPEDVAAEFEFARLGDERLDRRLIELAKSFAASPRASIPVATRNLAGREAAYRFFGNDRVTLDGVVSGHVHRTHQRALEAKRIRAVHDTTGLVYRGERDGLGPIKKAGQGFFAHVALGLSRTEDREPLGVLGVLTYAHEKNSPRKAMTRSQQAMASRSLPREDRLSSRWERLAHAVHDSLPSGVEAIHVMDQEGDDFTLICELVEAGISFVIRGSGSRLTNAARASVATAMESAQGYLFRHVALNPRSVHKSRGKGRPQRAERDAQLFIRWAPLEIRRPDHVDPTRPRLMPLTVVHVYEPNPPKGEEPVEWFLFTSEAINTIEDAALVVDDYRARWTIEELFKALKSGCGVESRQLTSFDALNRILGLLLPIAWRLLLLRHLSREKEPRAATAVMTAEQLKLLRVLLVSRDTRHELPKTPTVRDVMLAIAALGGHIRNNGDPGWIVLGRGYQLYVDAELLWMATRSDQS